MQTEYMVQDAIKKENSTMDYYLDLVSLFSVKKIVKKKINETKVVGFFSPSVCLSIYLSVCPSMTLCTDWLLGYDVMSSMDEARIG